MARTSYTGVADPEEAFEQLRPLADQLRALPCRNERDRQAVAKVLRELDSTAYHFTRRPGFFSG